MTNEAERTAKEAPGGGADESAAVGATAGAEQAAWRRWGEMRAAAERAEHRDLRLQAAFLVSAFLAVGLAVAAGTLGEGSMERTVAETALVGLLVVGSALLAFATRAAERDAGLLLRSGAADIESSVALYSTLLRGEEGREAWLTERVRAIRRRVFERLGRELTPRPAGAARASRRIDDELPIATYVAQRLEGGIDRQAARARRLDRARLRLTVALAAAVGAGLFCAAAGRLAATAAAAALALTLFGWLTLRRLAADADRCREVAFALGQLRDHWRGLPDPERTGSRFMRLVVATEKVLGCLWDDAALAARTAVSDLAGHQEDLLERILKMPASAALEAALEPAAAARTVDGAGMVDGAEASPEPEPEQEPGARTTRNPPHAFVVMPFGRKRGPDGEWTDFDRIYRQLIQPALVNAGFEPFRADEEKVSGDILTDMFQELLLADLVIADMSIDNANVFYELGVRHALRKRGVIHIQSGRSYMPFDVFNVRTLPYHCDATGKPDPAHLTKDRQTLAQCARETWASAKERIHSPIFNLLDGLNEPDRRSLQTPLASGYWREHRDWEQRMEVARRRRSVGDLLLLTEEAMNPLIQEEAISKAGLALRTLGLDELARRQYQRGIELNPKNRLFRREEAVHLGRLRRYEEAVVKLRRLLQDEPDDIEARFYLGEIYEDMWMEEFRAVDDPRERLEAAYQAEDWLKRAIETYLAAYRQDQNHAWSGTKALFLSSLLRHVIQEAQPEPDATDPEAAVIERQLEALRGAVEFTLESRARRGGASFGGLVRLGYVAVCEARDPKQVTRAFRKALAMAGKNRFFIEFTLERLGIFEQLGFRPEFTEAATAVFRKGLEGLRAEEVRVVREVYRPPRVFLFEGLEIDHGRVGEEQRFPADMEGEVRDRLSAQMDDLGASEDDLGITASASCGGDILFIEECLSRGMRVRVHLPLAKEAFIERSVGYAGGPWVQRFHALWNHPDVTFLIQEEHVGPVPRGDDAYERSNRWALYAALGHGIDRLCLILLWDGRASKERGGAQHMLQQVQSQGGQVEIIDASKFQYWLDRSGFVRVQKSPSLEVG